MPTQCMPQPVPDRQVPPAESRHISYRQSRSRISHHDVAVFRSLSCLAGSPSGPVSAPEAATTAGFAGLPPAAQLAGVSAMTANNVTASIVAESMCRQHSWPLSLEPGQNQFTIQVTASQVCVKLCRDTNIYLFANLRGHVWSGQPLIPLYVISGMQGRAIYMWVDVSKLWDREHLMQGAWPCLLEK